MSAWSTSGQFSSVKVMFQHHHHFPSHLINFRVTVTTERAEMPRHPHLQQLPPAPPEGSSAAPRQAWRYNPSSESWVGPGTSASLTMPGIPLKGGAQGHPYQMLKPPQLVSLSLKEQQVYSEPSQISKLLTQSQRVSLATLQR